MAYDTYRISIQVAENGFTVEVPDLEEIAKKKAKATSKDGLMPYVGDCTKSFVAKNAKEALGFVQQALADMPDAEYDTAFNEAAKKSK